MFPPKALGIEFFLAYLPGAKFWWLLALLGLWLHHSALCLCLPMTTLPMSVSLGPLLLWGYQRWDLGPILNPGFHLENLNHLQRSYFQVHVLRFQVHVNLGEHCSTNTGFYPKMIESAHIFLPCWTLLLARTTLPLIIIMTLPGYLHLKDSDSSCIKLGPWWTSCWLGVRNKEIMYKYIMSSSLCLA